MKRLALLLFFVSCVFTPALLHAKDILVPVDDYPPWKIVHDGKIIGGIDLSLVSALLEGLDLTPQYKLRPWSRCLLMMKNGDGDLISGITMNKKRREYLTYLTPPYKTKSQKVLYVRRGMKKHLRSLGGMEQKRIGLLRGAKYFSAFHENDAIIKNETGTDLQGMKMVVAGRLDGFLMTKENGEYLVKENPQLAKSLETAQWEHSDDVEVYFALSKRSDLIMRKNELEKRLKHLVDSGKIDKIINDFFKEPNKDGQP